MRFSRLTGLAALGFAACIAGANLVLAPAGLPLAGSPIGAVNAFYAEHGGLVGLVSALAPATWLLATLFGAGAVAVLWRSDRERAEAWSLVGFAGLLLQNLTFTGVIATRLALARTAPDASPDLWALHDAVFTLNGTFLATALVGLSVAGLRAGFVRLWHGVLGFVAAALQFTSATLAYAVMREEGPLGLIGLAGWLLWVVWIVVYGVRLVRVPHTIAR
ncbi:unnamed protein product [[Actinomadura] parvosata subsp. kistnae]|uniref:DUF4386 domain-containing protein n=1 Tax=[Actinomadura] parvosata subsp. kistnae TaxID=1909395 RepID=A0A1V0AE70_9ACTN|nr:hypothetical protein [Nonomuraea sp. ATCC 55076]AQZ68483.1 hypothetical protein BKM31_49700 [Nonomuraea sp. ATCC 55076]SPL93064.1 unnamed protein product [Actinomadura parvosata subsp. kistnae]